MKLHSGQIEGTQENVARVLEAYGIYDFVFDPINEGIENASFRIESAGATYVLRVYRHNRKSETEILRELEFQTILRKNGIPVPMIYPTSEGNLLATTVINAREHHAILMEFIAGQSVTTNPSLALLSNLASYQAKMHLIGIVFAKTTDSSKKPWHDLHDGHADKIKNPGVHGPEVEALIQRVRDYSYPLNPELPHGYNHLDIDFDGNVLTSGDRVTGIVDFDDLEYSPVVVCLGFTLWNILDDVDEATMWHYLHEYEKIRTLSTSEYQALVHVIFFRNYAIGITRLALWDDQTPKADIDDILKLEKEIPYLNFTLQT